MLPGYNYTAWMNNAANDDPYAKSQAAIQNASTRILASGGNIPTATSQTHPILNALSYIERPKEAIWSGINAAVTGKESLAQGIMNGLTGKENYTGSQVLGEAGWNPTSEAGKIAKGVAGFGLDVVGDPLTYIPGLGAGTFLKGFVTRTAATLAPEVAEHALSMGMLTKVADTSDTLYNSLLSKTADLSTSEAGGFNTADAQAKMLAQGWDKGRVTVVAAQKHLGDDIFGTAYQDVVGKPFSGTAEEIQALKPTQAQSIVEYGVKTYAQRAVNDPATLAPKLADQAAGVTADGSVPVEGNPATPGMLTSSNPDLQAQAESAIRSSTAATTNKGLRIGAPFLGGVNLITGTAMQDAGAATYKAIRGVTESLAGSKVPVLAPIARVLNGVEDGTRHLFDGAFLVGASPQEVNLAKDILVQREGLVQANEAAGQKTWKGLNKNLNAIVAAGDKNGVSKQAILDTTNQYREGAISYPEAVATCGKDAADLMSDTRRMDWIQGWQAVGANKLSPTDMLENHLPHKQALGVGGKIAKAFVSPTMNLNTAAFRQRSGGATLDDFESYVREELGSSGITIPAGTSPIERNPLNLYLMNELQTGSLLAETRTADAFKTVFGERVGSQLRDAAAEDGGLDEYLRDLRHQNKSIIVSRQLIKAVQLLDGGSGIVSGVEKLAEQRQELVDELGPEQAAAIMGFMGQGANKLTKRESDALSSFAQQWHNITPNIPLIPLSGDQFVLLHRVIQDAHIMPNAVYQKYIGTSAKQVNEGFKTVTDMIDGFHAMWKATVTGLRPGYLMGNYIGSNWQNYLDHGLSVLVDPELQYLAKRAAYRVGDWKSLPIKDARGAAQLVIDGHPVTLGEVHAQMGKYHAISAMVGNSGENVLGAVNREQAQSGVRRVVAKAEHLGKTLNGAIETDVRTANYIAWLRKGLNYSDAAKATNRVHFDYNDLTPAEMQVFRRIAPFYTWTRKNIPLALQELANQPRLATIPAQFTNDINTATGQNQQYMPSWAKNNMYIPNLIGMYLNKNPELQPMFNAKLPLADLTRIHNPITNMQGTAQEALAMLSPMFKLPIELATNQNLMTSAPLTSADMSTTQKIAAQAKYIVAQAGILSDAGKLGASAYQAASGTGAPASGSAMVRRGSGLNLVPWDNLGYNYNEQAGKLNASKSYERQLGNVLVALKKQGVDVPTIAQLKYVPKPIWEARNKLKRQAKKAGVIYTPPLSPALQGLLDQAGQQSSVAFSNYQ